MPLCLGAAAPLFDSSYLGTIITGTRYRGTPVFADEMNDLKIARPSQALVLAFVSVI